ncbi:MAG: NifU family protein [Betaproteobacteria bacterium]|nr:NifU family protein [Betaproteobacteria bacterium]
MPKIAEVELTPNPNARKFILKEPLTWGVARSFDSAEEAQDDPLANALFAIPHVTNVFYVDHWLTVTQDGAADWSSLLREVAVPIREAQAAEDQSQSYGANEADLFDDESYSPAEREKLRQISELLDERVRPFLQGDGGDLFIVGLEGNTLQVHYQGACGSCPSSLSGTLMGIESLVHQIDPMLEVVPV